MLNLNLQFFGGRGSSGGGGGSGGRAKEQMQIQASKPPEVLKTQEQEQRLRTGTNTFSVLSEVPKGTEIGIRTSSRDITVTKTSGGTARGVVWRWVDSDGGSRNIAAGNLADILNSGGNSVVGSISNVWLRKPK